MKFHMMPIGFDSCDDQRRLPRIRRPCPICKYTVDDRQPRRLCWVFDLRYKFTSYRMRLMLAVVEQPIIIM